MDWFKCSIFILILLGILSGNQSLRSHGIDLSYCDGYWITDSSLPSPPPLLTPPTTRGLSATRHNISHTIDNNDDYLLNGARTRYDPVHISKSVHKFLREACPAQQAGYSCYYTDTNDEERPKILEQRRFIPYNSSTCHPFTPHKFLHLLKNRRLLLLGDSVMGQTWESLVCALYNLPGLTTHLFTYFSQHVLNANNPLLVPVPIDFSRLGEQNPLHGHIVSGYLAIKELNLVISFQRHEPHAPDNNKPQQHQHREHSIREVIDMYRLEEYDIVIFNMGLHYNNEQHDLFHFTIIT